MHRSNLLMPLLCVALTGACLADLPIANSGFEDGLAGWSVAASPAVGEPSAAVTSEEAASIGKVGLRISANAKVAGSDWSLTSTPVPVQPGRLYQVECWSGGGGNHPGAAARLAMVFLDANGKSLEPVSAGPRKWPAAGLKGARYWSKATLAAGAPTGAVSLALRFTVPKGAQGSVDVDDLSVTMLPENPEPPPVVPPGAAHPVPPFDAARLEALLQEVQRDPFRGKPPVKVVLKLDDMKPTGGGGVHPAWLKWAQFAQEHGGIKLAYGMIANGLEGKCAPFCEWVKQQHALGTIEFWQHGYDHASHPEEGKQIAEFAGHDLDYQKQHYAKAQQLAHDRLGFAFTSFGAPENATNDLTVQVVSADPDTTVWMYGNPAQSGGKTVLERAYPVSLENPTFIPNYGAFVEGFAHNRGAEYFVLQGHPTHWDKNREEQFRKIVEFLIAQKAQFAFPRELAAKR